MHLARRISLLASIVLACGSAQAASSQPVPVSVRPSGPHPFVLPDTVGRYTRTSSGPLKGDSSTVAYKYSDGSATLVTVFVYRPDDAARAQADPIGAVSGQGQGFLATLPIGVQRGYWEEYVEAFSDPDSVIIGSRTIPGSATGAVTKRAGLVSVQLQYVYLVGAYFVKVRATVPEKGWEQTTAATFARALISALAAQ